jgi:hypothetical protein
LPSNFGSFDSRAERELPMLDEGRRTTPDDSIDDPRRSATRRRSSTTTKRWIFDAEVAEVPDTALAGKKAHRVTGRLIVAIDQLSRDLPGADSAWIAPDPS